MTGIIDTDAKPPVLFQQCKQLSEIEAVWLAKDKARSLAIRGIAKI